PAEASGHRAVALRERLEEPASLLGHDPDARVLHLEPYERNAARAGSGRDTDDDRSALRVLDCVAQQVDEHLAYPSRIPARAPGHIGRDQTGEVESPLTRGLGQEIDRVLDQGVELERDALDLEPAGLDLGEVEDVVDDTEERSRRRPPHLHELA